MRTMTEPVAASNTTKRSKVIKVRVNPAEEVERPVRPLRLVDDRDEGNDAALLDQPASQVGSRTAFPSCPAWCTTLRPLLGGWRASPQHP